MSDNSGELNPVNSISAGTLDDGNVFLRILTNVNGTPAYVTVTWVPELARKVGKSLIDASHEAERIREGQFQ